MKNVKNRSKFHEKMAVFCHFFAINGKLWVNLAYYQLLLKGKYTQNTVWNFYCFIMRVTCFFPKFPVTESFFTKLLPAESTSLSWNLLEGGPPTISSKC